MRWQHGFRSGRKTLAASGRGPMRVPLVMLLLAGVVLSSAILRVETVEATDPTGKQFRHLPVQWCAVKGSPTADSPGTADPDESVTLPRMVPVATWA